MDPWQQQLRDSLAAPAQLAARFDVDAAALEAVCARYPLRITPHYLDLIQEPGDPIWRQCVPDALELADDQPLDDPLAEEQLAPLPNVVHRYPDRVLLLVAGTCATYCRFCTRKRKVGCRGNEVSLGEVMAGIDYVARMPSVRDVLLSGGEPLLMSDLLLKEILERLRRIPHVEVIRIGTRAPVVLPARITEGLCALLRRTHPLYVNTHFNHPRELTPEAAEACLRLADAGVPVGNQTVLLRGVNDQAAILEELFRGLLRLRVRPYYLHHMDLVRGTGHFRTRLESGLEIFSALRGRLSGLAIPHYVVDLPGGRGKIPLVPEHVERLGDQALLRAPNGERVEFPNLCPL
ncbi:KamA family radical SAM protein [Geoalkalibacter halelectricus]|uniref:KamA family radical SAM protein n=1 Tax=Geoalkalibacter halelectricus TaxID=2847045 RepID=A0ABY5ZSP2_9BACT|nr:KamA family radical SAM protein [Geoalkalibacter halelectricus]MDO3377350.1 KamA family radical SAM protein [Geoalkalibacter halelectricus]UWZ80885.1 KamA family radical SAM protein [Geoalkalibacter halelectricus]